MKQCDPCNAIIHISFQVRNIFNGIVAPINESSHLHQKSKSKGTDVKAKLINKMRRYSYLERVLSKHNEQTVCIKTGQSLSTSKYPAYIIDTHYNTFNRTYRVSAST
ncbi:hypothetical protein SELMODRAFT_425646 [Selaginella moellendorffii]|uniref:Uncharacterized protein n=1 Tax=Selaginella moellendorffii TaxID=88036 RepID=D8STT0_SELML|nr:hypothetical protein SELMODRAFT_425646 [Selaginella moellendorffii]